MGRVLIFLLSLVLVVGCGDRGPMTWACPKCDVDLGADVRDLNASAFWGQYCAVCGHQTRGGADQLGEGQMLRHLLQCLIGGR